MSPRDCLTNGEMGREVAPEYSSSLSIQKGQHYFQLIAFRIFFRVEDAVLKMHPGSGFRVEILCGAFSQEQFVVHFGITGDEVTRVVEFITAGLQMIDGQKD